MVSKIDLLLKSMSVFFFSLTDDSYGYLPLPEDSGTKNNLTFDQPHDKVKLGATREKQSKVDCTVRFTY